MLSKDTRIKINLVYYIVSLGHSFFNYLDYRFFFVQSWAGNGSALNHKKNSKSVHGLTTPMIPENVHVRWQEKRVNSAARYMQYVYTNICTACTENQNRATALQAF